MKKVIVLSRVSTEGQDLTQQTDEVLREVYKDVTRGKGRCPQCGEENMAYQNGCLTSMSCGYSKCN